MILLLIIYMAVVSRMCGGMPPKLPSFIDQALFAAPFSIIVFLLYLPTVQSLLYPYPWHIWGYTALAGITALLGKLTGHGRGISLFEPLRGRVRRIEYLVVWAVPFLPTWVYKCLVLAVCEALVWLGIAVAVSPWLMLCAVIRPLSYLIGWGILLYAENNGHIRRTQTAKGKSVKRISFLPDYIGVHTAIGEALTGSLCGLVLYGILYI